LDAEQTAAEPGPTIPASHLTDTVPEGPIERLCHLLCALGLLAMVVVVATEVVTRNLFGFSFQVSDELGGYIIVAISFLSLCVCQANDTFHHVAFVQNRLSPRGRLVSRLFFDLLCLATCVLITWQLARLELNSWKSGDMAPTELMTPLWIPQILMAAGFAALTLTVLRTAVSHASQLARLRDTQQD
jgi:TRAP-type C4-dicarboxylate transport system permease small subunit